MDALNFIKEIDSNGTVVIRHFSTMPKLTAEISAGISEGQTIAFVPGQRSLRHFFNTQGFISAISEMITEIAGAEVVVPPGLYEGWHLVVLRPRAGANGITKSNQP